MKRTAGILIAAVIVGVLACSGPAPAEVRFGLIGGVNGAKVIGSDANIVPDWKDRISFQGGVFLTIGLGRFLAIEPEVLYTIKGAKTEYTESDVTYSGVLKYDYLEIPLLLKFRLPLGILTPYVFAGPSVGILLKDAVLEITGDSGTTDEPIVTSKLDYGAVFGGGLELGRSLRLDVRCSYGLKKLIDDAEGNSLDFRNQVLSANLSIVF